MKSLLTLASAATFLMLTPLDGSGAIVTWDGGGGNFSWQTAANWSGDALPGTLDDVVINVGGNITVTSSASVTIRSLQCSNHLALTAGTFRVSNADSVMQGQLFISGNSILSATGGFTTFNLPAVTNVDGAGLEALSGAKLSLPGLASFVKSSTCFNVTWQATGSNSVLELPGLTSLAGASCASLVVQALSGGAILLTNLPTMTEGTMSFLADGTDSRVDVSALQSSPGTLRTVSFEARNNGAISMPQFPGGKTVTVALKVGGSMPVAQLRELSGFTVSGTNANFPALTNLTTGNITVNSNAVVTATNLASYNGFATCLGPIWLVAGTGSVLNFSQLTNMTGPSCASLSMQATSGGTLLLTNLASISEGTLSFSADGSNSVINVAALQQCNATLRSVSFNVSNSGTILMPLLFGGPQIFASLASGGNLPVSQLRELLGFTVSGMNVNFTALTNLLGGDVTVNGGAIVAAPNLASHSQLTGCSGNTWLVSGAGSMLDFSSLTSLTGAACGQQNIWAKAGGTMNLSNLPLITDGTVIFLADGSSSVMNLNALAQTTGSHGITFSVANSGTILAPSFSGSTNAFVTLQSGGVFPAAQMRRLLGFTVTGMMVDFTSLTNLAAGSVTVNGGGMAAAPNLTRHDEFSGCVGNTWLATGAGSVLDFSSLTNFAGATCGLVSINGTAGGHVLLGQLVTLSEGTVSFLADGTNSLIDLGSLAQSFSTNHNVSLTAQNSGVILVPIFQGGETLAMTIKSGGSLDTAELKLLKSLTVSGTSLNLPGITNLFAGDLTVDQAAVLSLPNLFNHVQGGICSGSAWSVSGVGSVLDLSSMTNLTGAPCGFLNINALAGGYLNLSNLLTISDGVLAFLGDGTNSLVDLGRLQNSLATTRSVAFEARNRGRVGMPLMSGGATVAVTIKTNGVMSTAQFRQLSTVTVLATNAGFDSLTNFDGGSFTVSNSGNVSAPALLTYAKGSSCIPAAWLASGTGSVLNLSGLSRLTGGSCLPLNVIATNGGQILLAGLGNIPSGTVAITSVGAGSLVGLNSLSNFLHATGLSKLTATNSGAIQLNDQPLFLSGVNLNFAAGTPGISPAVFAPTNLLVHGHAWRSYWAEKRDTTSPLNAWNFFRRIPLTNDFQIIGAIAPANTEYRAWEFIADPFALELAVDANNASLVLYAPTNQSFGVQSTTNLLPPVDWSPLASVTMTNTFRILPPVPLVVPQRYFRVNPL